MIERLTDENLTINPDEKDPRYIKLKTNQNFMFKNFKMLESGIMMPKIAPLNNISPVANSLVDNDVISVSNNKYYFGTDVDIKKKQENGLFPFLNKHLNQYNFIDFNSSNIEHRINNEFFRIDHSLLEGDDLIKDEKKHYIKLNLTRNELENFMMIVFEIEKLEKTRKEDALRAKKRRCKINNEEFDELKESNLWDYGKKSWGSKVNFLSYGIKYYHRIFTLLKGRKINKNDLNKLGLLYEDSSKKIRHTIRISEDVYQMIEKIKEKDVFTTEACRYLIYIYSYWYSVSGGNRFDYLGTRSDGTLTYEDLTDPINYFPLFKNDYRN